MTKRILHISKYYFPDTGGIETVAQYLAEGLDNDKNFVAAFSTTGKDEHDNINGIDVYRIKINFRISSQDIGWRYHSKIKRLIKTVSPDIIVVHCPNPFAYPCIYKVPKGCKVILLWHSDILMKGWMYKIIKPVESLALKKADLILATSPNYINVSSPIYKYKDKVKVLQNGIITENFNISNEEKLAIASIKKNYEGKIIALFVGRHVAYKGIDKIMEIEKNVKSDVVFLIAGYGPLTDKLKAANKSERIKFLGRLSNDVLKLYYYAADIFTFSSVTKAEAFGVALAEAMYCGCVPITFQLEGSGVNWVSLDGITGEVVPINDTCEYAKRIDKIACNEELRQKYSTAARQRIIENFSDKKAIAMAKVIFNNM